MNDMDRGKEKCDILINIRTYVAEKYGNYYSSTIFVAIDRSSQL